MTTAIYAIYAGPKGDYQTGNLDDKRVAAYLSKSLRAALKAMDARSKKLNEPILDFDPVTDSQDPQVEKLAIAGGDTAAVATFFSGDVKHVVRYSFVREGARGRSTTSPAAPATTMGSARHHQAGEELGRARRDVRESGGPAWSSAAGTGSPLARG